MPQGTVGQENVVPPWDPNPGPVYDPGGGGMQYPNSWTMPKYRIKPIAGKDQFLGTWNISMPQGYSPWSTGAFDAVTYPGFAGGLTQSQLRKMLSDEAREGISDDSWGFNSVESALLAKGEFQANMINAVKQQQLSGIYGNLTRAAQDSFGSREAQVAGEQALRGQGMGQRMLSMENQLGPRWQAGINDYGQHAQRLGQGIGDLYGSAMTGYTDNYNQLSGGLGDAYGIARDTMANRYGQIGGSLGGQTGLGGAYGNVGTAMRDAYGGVSGDVGDIYSGAGTGTYAGYGNVASLLGDDYGELAKGLGEGYEGLMGGVDTDTDAGLARIQEKFDDERGRLTQQGRASGLVSSRDMVLQSRLARDQQIAEQDYLDKQARRREAIQMQGLGVQQQVGMGRLGATGQALMGGAAGYGQALMGGAAGQRQALMAGTGAQQQALMGGVGALGGALMAGEGAYGQMRGQQLGQRGRDIGAIMSGQLGMGTAGLGSMAAMRQAELAQRGGWVTPQMQQQYGMMSDWNKAMSGLGQEYAGYGQGRFGKYVDSMYGAAGLGGRYADQVERMSGANAPNLGWFAQAAAQQITKPGGGDAALQRYGY